MAVDPLLQPILEGFLREAKEIGARLTGFVLPLESGQLSGARAEEAVREIARGLHTLKGSSATLGLDQHAELAHALEDRFAPVVSGAAVDRACADALLGGLDAFLQAVQASTRGESATDRLTRQLASLRQLDASEPQAATPLEEPAAPAELRDGWRIAEAEVNACLSGIERLREIRLRLDERRRAIERMGRTLLKLLPGAASAQLRSELDGLDATLASDAGEIGETVSSFEATFRTVCTVPVRGELEPLHRMVRDLSHELEKEAQLSIVGAELSLDRRVMDGLRGAIVHLIRNAVDHGLERPEIRERAGKHRVGALVVRLERVGAMLFVEVSDDGGGVDLEAVRARALERGLLTSADAQTATSEQLHALLFRAGFSSRAEVTEVSGRGVGLDVVKRDVERLNGRVELHSTKGQGTRFTLAVPSELGTAPVLVVRAGDQSLAVPMLAIEAMRLCRATELRRRGDRLLLEHREALVPLQDLAALLGIRAARAIPDGVPLLVLQHGGKHLALAVDEVVGDRELNQRPLPTELQSIAAFQGAAVMADGELVLTLRPEWLVQDGGARAQRVTSAPRALVVDDSLTARALHRTMLEAGGYEVHTAQDGLAGLEQVKRARYDVVVCDIGMEPMNGFDFTRALRARPEGEGLAVILVSAHEEVEHLAEGLDAGADAHLAKRECASGRLLEEIARVLARRRAKA